MLCIWIQLGSTNCWCTTQLKTVIKECLRVLSYLQNVRSSSNLETVNGYAFVESLGYFMRKMPWRTCFIKVSSPRHVDNLYVCCYLPSIKQKLNCFLKNCKVNYLQKNIATYLRNFLRCCYCGILITIGYHFIPYLYRWLVVWPQHRMLPGGNLHCTLSPKHHCIDLHCTGTISDINYSISSVRVPLLLSPSQLSAPNLIMKLSVVSSINVSSNFHCYVAH
jgi:hypothetical protein